MIQAIYDDLPDPKYRPYPLLKEMVAAGYRGRKTGRGIYRFIGLAGRVSARGASAQPLLFTTHMGLRDLTRLERQQRF
jgi:3-hydroxyacyl-CoA dehydrogenase